MPGREPVTRRRETDDDLALSPPQVLRQLGAEAQASGRLAATLFLRLEPAIETWAIEPLDAAAVSLGLAANLYGNASGRESATIIEGIDGGRVVPASKVLEQLAAAAPGYTLLLGPGAYEGGDLVRRLVGMAGALG